jgi:ArsR family metal-binding transcriptional regulator
LHHVADLSLGEDACRVRKGAAPAILATLRRGLVPLLSDLKQPRVAAALRANVPSVRATLARLFPQPAEP